ncbi:MAG: AzlD domain-containing protein [Pseudomonadota bacterium]
MPLSPQESTLILLTVLALALGNALTRFLPFLLFSDNKELPPLMLYLGRVLPPAMMALLVVYCFKSTPVVSPPHAVPELIAVAAIILIHAWRRNVLLSIGVGTALYMLLVQGYF